MTPTPDPQPVMVRPKRGCAGKLFIVLVLLAAVGGGIAAWNYYAHLTSGNGTTTGVPPTAPATLTPVSPGVLQVQNIDQDMNCQALHADFTVGNVGGQPLNWALFVSTDTGSPPDGLEVGGNAVGSAGKTLRATNPSTSAVNTVKGSLDPGRQGVVSILGNITPTTFTVDFEALNGQGRYQQTFTCH